ncbi:COQ9 family protein [Roseomonas xinghualingensis]|uniref:COQ9 family protein n=1 Tax=Roseomonas xinghualingensis TaxID=2986475 RepID=UPI0021F1B629|nr:COQ9 family protein [Roseomonas sp. SXEYE001]MCV4207307.1 COQ9 family protein [Roseomonas sp. SXEYE001]
MIERSPERDAAILATLPHVPRLGWTEAALEAGLRGLGEDPVAHRWLFPRGPVGAVEAWIDLTDRRMEEAATREALEELRIPARIRRLIDIRLTLLEPQREQLRRALALLALPWNAGVGAGSLARTVDSIWGAAGDRSADFSWYTRRASLGAIYVATLAYWLREAGNHEGALAFLDRRLADLAGLQRRKSSAAT